MNSILAFCVLCGFATNLTTARGLNETGCSPIVNNTWESPRYPSSYPRNLDCNISVPIPSGAAMRIFFQAFYIPYGSFGYCWGDYLVIRNENGEDFGRYCGFRPGTTALLNGTIVVLTFHSDSTNNGGRFRLVFTPIYRNEENRYPNEQACPQLINNTLESGGFPSHHFLQRIESPGFPSNYTQKMDCNISIPIPLGHTMLVFFQDFNIYQYYSWTCRYYGYVEIMNEQGYSFGKYCGSRNGQVVVVNGRLVVLRFRSGSYGSFGRFRLLLTPETAPPSTQRPTPATYQVCPQLISNTVRSPGYPYSYSHRMDCNISFPIPSGESTYIFFRDFNIPQYFFSCWYYGYLEIMNEKGDSFGKYCGRQSGNQVTVNGSLVVLRFVSGYYGSYGRFELSYSFGSKLPTARPGATQHPRYPACAQLINSNVESPGYPGYYRHRMDCNVSVPIPSGATMRIFFQDFNIRQYYSSCWYYGYLEIMNENGDNFGKFCGDRQVQPVLVNGSFVVLKFQSGNYGGHGRFRLLLTPVYPFTTSQPGSSRAVLPSHASQVVGHTSYALPLDAQSQLKNFIANLRDILVQMEYVVNNQLSGPSFGNSTKRDHIARVNDAVKYVETAMKRAGQQMHNLDRVIFEQLKKRAAEIIAKMEDEEGQYKERAQLEDRMLVKDREESIQKNELKEEKKEA